MDYSDAPGFMVKTKDSDEAAYLWTRDKEFFLDHVETSEFQGNGKIVVWFFFTTKFKEDVVSEIRYNYRLGKARVEPKDYSRKRNEIKAIIKEKCQFFKS